MIIKVYQHACTPSSYLYIPALTKIASANASMINKEEHYFLLENSVVIYTSHRHGPAISHPVTHRLFILADESHHEFVMTKIQESIDDLFELGYEKPTFIPVEIEELSPDMHKYIGLLELLSKFHNTQQSKL